jgi:hypothetical protein
MKTREEMFRQLRKEEDDAIEKGMACLRTHLDPFDVQDFLHSYYLRRVDESRGRDYTEWRRDHVCVGMSVDEISRDAMEYCRSIGMYAEEEKVKVKVAAPVAA